MGYQGACPWDPRVGARGIPGWVPMGSQVGTLGDHGPLETHRPYWRLGTRALGDPGPCARIFNMLVHTSFIYTYALCVI